MSVGLAQARPNYTFCQHSSIFIVTIIDMIILDISSGTTTTASRQYLHLTSHLLHSEATCRPTSRATRSRLHQINRYLIFSPPEHGQSSSSSEYYRARISDRWTGSSHTSILILLSCHIGHRCLRYSSAIYIARILTDHTKLTCQYISWRYYVNRVTG